MQTTKKNAAIYCRSSKDRAEIGLDTQRKELKKFADNNDLHIAQEFSDMEVSGSLDETSRPGLRSLLAAMTAPERTWDFLLVVDTSRLARDTMLALYIQRECDRHNVEIRYSKVAVNSKDAVGEMLLAQLRAFDRFHGRMSAEKGRAGLEQNIANGHRAGGRAPTGYKLERTATGSMRSGMPVFKSKLVPDPRAAKKVQAFLQARAAGTPRHLAARNARLDKVQASLISIERNALTYSGYTVWNQRKKQRPTRDDNRTTMHWRPRAEWIITPEKTHEALITREEAERILAGVDRDNPKPRGIDVRNPDSYLLTGLLFAPDGRSWQADGDYYRLGRKGKRVRRSKVDQFVLESVEREIRDDKFVAELVQAAHDMADGIVDDPGALDGALRGLDAKIGRLTTLVAETGNRALIAKLDELEVERTGLLAERATAADRARMKKNLRRITAKQVEAMLEFAPVNIAEGSEIDVPYMRRTLGALVRRIELDPQARTVQFNYTVGLGAKLASPRGFEPLLPP